MTSTIWIIADALGGILFFGSGFYLWKFLRVHMPMARGIPDELILEWFREDAKKHKLWTLPLRPLYEEVEYREFFRTYRGRLLYRLHIGLLRLDNRILAKYNQLRGVQNEDKEREEDQGTTV